MAGYIGAPCPLECKILAFALWALYGNSSKPKVGGGPPCAPPPVIDRFPMRWMFWSIHRVPVMMKATRSSFTKTVLDNYVLPRAD